MTNDKAIPRHVAIIMDGNGRWAESRGLPRTAGHKKGIDAVKTVLQAAHDQGISYLTLFVFSVENWQRPVDEVNELMGLMRLYVQSELATLHKNNIVLRIMGDRARLPDDLQDLLLKAEQVTAANTGLTLVVALSYGGRQDIVQATRALANRVKTGELTVDAIDEMMVGQSLWAGDIPDPDLIIRTSGEQRLSNFLLWQAAYAEFVFITNHWPDFTAEDLSHAIETYASRDRRFGLTHSRRAQ